MNNYSKLLICNGIVLFSNILKTILWIILYINQGKFAWKNICKKEIQKKKQQYFRIQLGDHFVI